MKAPARPLQQAAAVAVTAQYDFGSSTPQGEALFSVRGGVPITEALDRLAVFLAASKEAITQCAESEGEGLDDIPAMLWQSVYLIGFSEALVESVHRGFTNSRAG